MAGSAPPEAPLPARSRGPAAPAGPRREPDTGELAVELTRVLGRGWRRLRRQLGKELGEDSQPELEVELLRLTAVRPGLRVGEAAAELGLAPNTVSTVVTRLVEAGLLERVRDDADRRAAHLILSGDGRARMTTRRDLRRAVVAAALERLSEEDRATLAGAVPAFARLIETIGR